MSRMLMLIVWSALLASCSRDGGRVNAGAADPDVIAVVLGRNISSADKSELNRMVFSALLHQFALDNAIEPTEEELEAFALKSKERKRQSWIRMEADRKSLKEKLTSPSLSDRERDQKTALLGEIEVAMEMIREREQRAGRQEGQMSAIEADLARQFVTAWKINRALYDQYGGRVIFQQAGPEPIDAYRDFLKEQESIGAFQIVDSQYKAGFWHYFTNDAMHSFMDEEQGARFLDTPWWMMDGDCGNPGRLPSGNPGRGSQPLMQPW